MVDIVFCLAVIEHFKTTRQIVDVPSSSAATNFILNGGNSDIDYVQQGVLNRQVLSIYDTRSVDDEKKPSNNNGPLFVA